MLRRTFFRLVNFIPVYMPALSPSMETGTLVEWKKQVGELVKENDVFCTIQTDKAVVDFTNTFEEGYLAKIYCQNGQVAPVTQTIAVMVDEEGDISKGKEYVPEDGAGASEESAAAEPLPVAAAAPATSSATAPATAAQGSNLVSSEPPEDVNCIPVYMPALSPSMETGTLVEWKKQVGELVKENDVFCTIQTDKAVVDFTNTFEEGYLAKIYCQNGQVAPVTQTIAVMVSETADVPKVKNYYPADVAGTAQAMQSNTPSPAAAAAAPATHPISTKDHSKMIQCSGPSVIRIASGLAPSVLSGIQPSGKGGRYVKSDFANQPGFDYNDAVAVPSSRTNTSAVASTSVASSKPKQSAQSAAPVPARTQSGVWDVATQPGIAMKSLDDTELLQRLLKSMSGK